MADHTDPPRSTTPLGESFVDIASDSSPEDDMYSEKSTALSIIRKNSEEADDDGEVIDDREISGEEMDADSVHDTPADQGLPDETEPSDGLCGGSNATLSAQEVDFIRCKELEHSPEEDVVDAVHPMHVFDDRESAVISKWRNVDLHAGGLSATVRMKLSKQPLTLDRPLRVLYVGNSEQRPEVLARFGDALMANPSEMDQSQFQVIATSDEPNAPTELVPIQAQIIVDECGAIASVKTHQGQQEQIYLRLKKGKGLFFKSTWNDGQFELHDSQKWVAPDLAVLLFSTRDNNVEKERLRLASEFMRRHNVPMLVLSDLPSWMSDIRFPDLDHQSLHLSLEPETRTQEKSTVLQRLPTDLETFGRIDACQLNRHVAGLLKDSNIARNAHIEVEGPSRICSTPSSWRMKDIEKNLSKSLYQKDVRISRIFEKRALEASAALILTLLTALAVYCFCWVMVPKSSPGPLNIPGQLQSPQALASMTPTTTSTLAIPSVKASAPNSLVSVERYETSLSTIPTDLKVAKTRTDQAKEQSNDPAEFTIEISGSNEMTIVPPYKFAAKNRAKTPFFRVDIRRGNQNLVFDLNKKDDQTWTVSIFPEESFGKLNVTVTVFNPSEIWSHEIDFGTPWFNLTDWMQSSPIVARQFLNQISALKNRAFSHYAQRVQDERQDDTWLSLRQRLQALQGNATFTVQNTTRLVYMRSHKLFETCVIKVNKEYNGLQKLGTVMKKEVKQYGDNWQLIFRALHSYYRPGIKSRYRQFTSAWDSVSSSVSHLKKGISSKSFLSRWPGNVFGTAQSRAKAVADKILAARSSSKAKGAKPPARDQFRQHTKKGARKAGKKRSDKFSR